MMPKSTSPKKIVIAAVTVVIVVFVSVSLIQLLPNAAHGNRPTGGGDAIHHSEVNDSRVGTVSITSGGETFVPVGYKVFEFFRNGVSDQYYTPHFYNLGEDVPIITYSPDFSFEVTGGRTAFDPELITISGFHNVSFRTTNIDEFIDHLGEGTYTVAVEVNWGNPNEFVGFWYYFRLVVEE